MEEAPLNPESEAERKRRERAAFEAYFLKEKAREDSRNRTAIFLIVGIMGFGVVIYLALNIFIALIGALH